MHNYRAYLFGWDGHIIDGVELFCDNDAAAEDRARAMVDGYDVELWDGARKIARVDRAIDREIDPRTLTPCQRALR